MDNTNNKNNIIIMTYQHSIVVKGIEKKLVALGYNVNVIVDDIGEVRSNLEVASLFILYTQEDIVGNMAKINILGEICTLIRDKEINILVVGEQKYHEDILNAVPALADYQWLNRPINMDDLAWEVRSVLGSGKRLEKRRILIIDDDPSYAKMVREWLKDTYRVDIVTAGMQGISFIVKNKVDLLLLDYEMPVADGPQILELLRNDPDTANIPVVFLTGIADKESIARVMSLKPMGYFLKSATRSDLRQKLRELFAKLESK